MSLKFSPQESTRDHKRSIERERGGYNYQLVIAYDGSTFYGWQKTKMGPSIEEEIEKALFTLTKETPALQAASRTDRGVHARSQVVQFLSDKEIHKKNLNGLLPKTIRVLECKKVSPSFHPTTDVISKEYRYSICLGPIQLPHLRKTSWHCPQIKHLDRMKEALPHLIGTHDFEALCNVRKDVTYKTYTRTIHSLTITQEDQHLTLSIIGDHFLYKMARNIVGLLVGIGEGKLSPEDIPHILSSKQRSHSHVAAPAHGLHLHNILY